MLNRAARYFPILRELRQCVAANESILEVGSGALGVGEFHAHPFVGCDVGFRERPKSPMLPVLATATMLPFGDGCFDAVIVSDVLEHVPPEHRPAVIGEALRVARKVAIFGFPSGPGAFEYDQKLAKAYNAAKQEMPVWLQEHLRHPYPTEVLFQQLGGNWIVKIFANDNLDFHYFMMRAEMHRLLNYLLRACLAASPGIVEFLLKRTDREPCYRKIVMLTRARDGNAAA